MSRRNRIIIFAAIIAGVVWAAFRPELLFISKTVNESLPTTGDDSTKKILVTGTFFGVAHETKGLATIYRLEDGEHVLRLSDFETSNGPDVRVLLATAEKPMDSETVTSASTISLGSLKGNKGDQNYKLPADFDLIKFNSVVIWCNRFDVNFGAAPLRNE